MKKTIISMLFAAAAALLVLSCAKEENPEPVNSNDTAVATYTLTVDASKGPDTKALAIDGNTISATWADGETVSVYNSTKGAALSGTLAPTTYGSASATLSGTLMGTIEADDVLVLTFRSAAYGSQDGTLDYIAANCDYATASITVASVDGYNNITATTAANFESHQTIVKFTLQDDAANAITPNNVVFKHGAETITLSGIPAATYTANGDGVLFVAIPGFASEALSIKATTSAGDEYIYQKDGVTFNDGTYRRITVRMYNELTTPLTFEAMVAGATVTFTQGTQYDNLKFYEDVQYSTDGSSWTTYESGTGITLANVGDKVMFRGRKTRYAAGAPSSYHALFSTSADCYIYGNMMSLLGSGSEDSFNFSTRKTIYGNLAFMYLFNNNTHIKSHSYKTIAFPATTLSEECYQGMFYGCTGLTSAPALPATNLKLGCYEEMFYGCTGLESAPALPATTLANSCYKEMFNGCTSLTSAPALPATTLANSCYSSMFYGCTGLKSAPALPAETAPYRCYYSMFQGCTGLTSAPALPATTLNEACYQSMFGGCTSLATPPALPATTYGTATSCFKNMFKGCTKLASAPDLSSATLTYSTGSNCFESMFEGCTSLVTPPSLPSTTVAASCYMAMFKGCTSLATAPALPAATAYSYCYKEMFKGCTSLAVLPALPSTNIYAGCYSAMFSGCTSISSIPDSYLPASSLVEHDAMYCYSEMFKGCTGLSSIPYDLLPATTLTEGCYSNMFEGCTGVYGRTPYLNAAVLPNRCYYMMFSGCTNLGQLRNFPASTIGNASCDNMFSECVNLDIVPDFTSLSSVGEDGCEYMFYHCAKLKKAPELPATTLSSLCYKSMFQNCVELETAPSTLPATTLANECYWQMFFGCAKLTTAPTLPATTLVKNCYYKMFKNCSWLSSVTCLATDGLDQPSCLTEWLSGVWASGTFTTPSTTAWNEGSVSGIPSGWTRVAYVAP